MLWLLRIFRFDSRNEVLRGENKAALEVARRTGLSVDLTARYEQYGMSEQALWDRIAEMDEWWRETTWYVLYLYLSRGAATVKPDPPAWGCVQVSIDNKRTAGLVVYDLQGGKYI
jgi:hypothetical protein